MTPERRGQYEEAAKQACNQLDALAMVSAAHDRNGIKQFRHSLATNLDLAMASPTMKKIITAKFPTIENPVLFLSSELARIEVNQRLGDKKQAERRLAIEIFADALGIKPQVNEAYCNRHKQSPSSTSYQL